MTLFEVVLKSTYNSELISLSRMFPSTKIFVWCNRNNDVIEVIARNPEEYPVVLEELRKVDIGGVVEESSINRRICLIVHNCLCMEENTIVKHIGELDLLNVFPNMIEDGWVYHRVIVFRHEDFEELLRRLERSGWFYKILRKVSFDGFLASSLTISADALFSDLTRRQSDAILTAYRHGYYSLPRTADVQTIAAKEKVPRTTFQEHLKKAENKIVGAIVPYMRLFGEASMERRKTLKVKN